MSGPVVLGFVVGMTLGFLLIACLVCEFWALSLRVDRIEAHVHGEPPAPHRLEQLRARWASFLEERRANRDETGLDDYLESLHEPAPDLEPAEPRPPARPRPVPGPEPATAPVPALITPEAITGGRHRALDPGQPRSPLPRT